MPCIQSYDERGSLLSIVQRLYPIVITYNRYRTSIRSLPQMNRTNSKPSIDKSSVSYINGMISKYQSIWHLTYKHWNKLTVTILKTNPSIIEDLLQYKMAILHLNQHLSNPCLIDKRENSTFASYHSSTRRQSAILFSSVLCFLSLL